MLPESKSKYRIYQLLTLEVQEKLDTFNGICDHSISLLFEYLLQLKERNFLEYYKEIFTKTI